VLLLGNCNISMRVLAHGDRDPNQARPIAHGRVVTEWVWRTSKGAWVMAVDAVPQADLRKGYLAFGRTVPSMQAIPSTQTFIQWRSAEACL
jgi:hypothetical protein